MIQAQDLIINRFKESISVKEKIINDTVVINTINTLANIAANTIKNGNKLIICGNGGSASDALHFAGEVVGRFVLERPAWPAIVLNADVASMTAIANDYGYNEVFARQAEGLTQKGDLFIGISTSGNSQNVSRAIEVAQKKGAITAALLGKDGGEIKAMVDHPVVVKSNTTARIQESHICIIHIICELIEQILLEKTGD